MKKPARSRQENRTRADHSVISGIGSERRGWPVSSGPGWDLGAGQRFGQSTIRTKRPLGLDGCSGALSVHSPCLRPSPAMGVMELLPTATLYT